MIDSCGHGYGVCSRCATVVSRCRCRCPSTNVDYTEGPCFVCKYMDGAEAEEFKALNEAIDVPSRYRHPLHRATTQ